MTRTSSAEAEKGSGEAAQDPHLRWRWDVLSHLLQLQLQVFMRKTSGHSCPFPVFRQIKLALIIHLLRKAHVYT